MLHTEELDQVEKNQEESVNYRVMYLALKVYHTRTKINLMFMLGW
jgi:hypothetical protein